MTEFVSDALRLGLTNLLAVALLQVTMSSARIALEHVGGLAHGAEYNGQFQAAHAIGSQYFALVLSSLGTYFFPRYAAAQSSEALEAEVRRASAFVLRFGAPLLVLLLAVRDPIIRLLYSDRFGPASQLLGLTLAGDIAKGIGWAYAGPLLYRGDITGYIVTESIGAVVAVTANFVFVAYLGLDGIGTAYLLTYACYAVVTAFVLERRHGVRMRGRELLLAIGAALAAAALARAARNRPLLDLLLLAWAVGWAARSGAMKTISTGLAARWQRSRSRRTEHSRRD